MAQVTMHSLLNHTHPAVLVSHRRCMPFKAASPNRARNIRLTCQAAGQSSNIPDTSCTQSRRSLLLAGGVLLSLPLLSDQALADMETNKSVISVRGLSAFQRSAQRNYLAQRSERELKKVVTPEDAPTALRLVIHDAATFDVATGQGGLNGSIINSEELGREENKDLKSFVDKLAGVKKIIDEKGKTAGQEAISWADLIVLAAKVAHVQSWTAQKVKRASIAQDGSTIAEAFGAAFPLPLGRVDATSPDAPVQVPTQTASPAEVKSFFNKLGNENKGGFAAGKAPFWERPAFVLWTQAQPDPAAAEAALAEDNDFKGWKAKYDRSRRTVTRTEYEVDFITYFTKIANLGAKFDGNKYLYPITLDLPKIK
ncbi:TPA: hypothetical protein ACH3X1_015471 [Trebouxia sp. C0004]